MVQDTNKATGFGVVGVVIAITVAIVAVGFVGWRVWDANKSSQASTQSNASANNSSINPTSTVTMTYLDIKELGVKIKLSEDIKDALYYYDTSISANPIARVSTQSLINKSNKTCDPKISSPFGSISKTQLVDQPDGSVLSPNGTNVFQIGKEYIVYSTPTQACSIDKIAADLQTSQLQSFKEAIKTIQSDK